MYVFVEPVVIMLITCTNYYFLIKDFIDNKSIANKLINCNDFVKKYFNGSICRQQFLLILIL